jgi:hypothetical protein
VGPRWREHDEGTEREWGHVSNKTSRAHDVDRSPSAVRAQKGVDDIPRTSVSTFFLPSVPPLTFSDPSLHCIHILRPASFSILFPIRFNFEGIFTIYDIFFALGLGSTFLFFNVAFTPCILEPTSLRCRLLFYLSFHARSLRGAFVQNCFSIILLQFSPYKEARIYLHFGLSIVCLHSVLGALRRPVQFWEIFHRWCCLQQCDATFVHVFGRFFFGLSIPPLMSIVSRIG